MPGEADARVQPEQPGARSPLRCRTPGPTHSTSHHPGTAGRSPVSPRTPRAWRMGRGELGTCWPWSRTPCAAPTPQFHVCLGKGGLTRAATARPAMYLRSAELSPLAGQRWLRGSHPRWDPRFSGAVWRFWHGLFPGDPLCRRGPVVQPGTVGMQAGEPPPRTGRTRVARQQEDAFSDQNSQLAAGSGGGGTGPGRAGAARGGIQGSPRPESSQKSVEENQLLLLHSATSCPGPSPSEKPGALAGDSARPWDPLLGWGTGQGQGVPLWGQPQGFLPGKPSPGEPRPHHTPRMRLSP